MASDKVNPSPAGTVKPLMLTVVQDAAAETSLRELIVAVQAVAAESAPGRRERAAKRASILMRGFRPGVCLGEYQYVEIDDHYISLAEALGARDGKRGDEENMLLPGRLLFRSKNNQGCCRFSDRWLVSTPEFMGWDG